MYNATEMGVAVKRRPEEAKAELLDALREVEGDAEAGARRYGVTRRTWDRWLSALRLQEHAAEIRAKMIAERNPTP